eukprot:14583394-Alexandrium_andersonii.AAC.1
MSVDPPVKKRPAMSVGSPVKKTIKKRQAKKITEAIPAEVWVLSVPKFVRALVRALPFASSALRVFVVCMLVSLPVSTRKVCASMVARVLQRVDAS